ncbi:MAG: DUF61 family protein [Candidatus Hodarchaeaceae archaeon]|nr:DUF61 family protein [Candidatus Hodarchaeaceae archaeon]MDI6883807.1 DUF61 family protein [Hadesarchaea archaeon]
MERIIKLELGRLNVHLPERRISLREALSSPKPSVRTRDGSTHFFKREELESLSKLLPETDWDKLQLPILIALDPKLGRGAARISGEPEARVAGKILNKRAAGELLIYRPEVAALRRELPTTTQYLFM